MQNKGTQSENNKNTLEHNKETQWATIGNIIGKQWERIGQQKEHNRKNIKPTRSFKEDDNDDGKASSALGSLGLKPKPAI